jgi:hypothetical protein
VFLSSDDEGAAGLVAALAEQLGFAPVELGKLEEGGALVQARDRTWTQLIFQDFIKFEWRHLRRGAAGAGNCRVGGVPRSFQPLSRQWTRSRLPGLGGP